MALLAKGDTNGGDEGTAHGQVVFGGCRGDTGTEDGGTSPVFNMQWSRTWLNGLGEPVGGRLQVLAQHLQMFLDRTWDGADPHEFLRKIQEEHEQLRTQLVHKRLSTMLITNSLREIANMTAVFAAEIH